MTTAVLLFLVALFTVALLYAAVGHGGASGYIAIMTLYGLETATIRSTALVLNLLVSFIAFAQYYRQGHFRWNLFYPFALASVPFSFIGSLYKLQDALYAKIVAILLLLSIARLLWMKPQDNELRPLPLPAALLAGAGIGLLSGMIGIGGGIILSPLVLLLRWGSMKETAAVSALFIFVNSLAGLSGLVSKDQFVFPGEAAWWLLLTLTGGLIGAYWGSRMAATKQLRYLLAAGLTVATLKLLLI